ncbi:lipopolysaccharide assembly protein LapB [Marinifilum sp. D714]|uniref:tetratricopeptide repeat protein n=1 Tax=Marinifilum sp. D714 TaxID=2937523 RepID=UPI0027C23AC7|nr:hypothetical protein [Marinifilum sp. D714]MDQ2177810.1 hypothetical protein [Marinifilum sp. D714]
MKKLILFIAVCFCATSLFAQSAEELKNAGNDALRSKDYKTALEKYEAFLGAEDTFEDTALVFNAAYCANKSKDYAKAEKYFAQSVANNYKLSKSYQYLALVLKKQKKYDEMVATLNKGIEACPTKNKKLKASLAKHYFSAAQKANNFEKSEDLYKKAAGIESKYKETALLALGQLYYNKGAEFWPANQPKAKSYFEKSTNTLNDVLKMNPGRKEASDLIATIKGLVK